MMKGKDRTIEPRTPNYTYPAIKVVQSYKTNKGDPLGLHQNKGSLEADP